MLFKVYQQEGWWLKHWDDNFAEFENKAYVFDSNNPSDMMAFNEGSFYSKDDCAIKLVTQKVPSPETKIALEEAESISKGEQHV